MKLSHSDTDAVACLATAIKQIAYVQADVIERGTITGSPGITRSGLDLLKAAVDQVKKAQEILEP
jgi:hypothetical protein